MYEHIENSHLTKSNNIYLISFDGNGIIQSDNFGLLLNNVEEKNIKIEFPIIDSIWTAITGEDESIFPINFQRIDTPHVSLQGYYDFRIIKDSKGGCTCFNLYIVNRTKEYQLFQKESQTEADILYQELSS